MKIAYTSCFDALDDADQQVWDRVAEHDPNILLLLGDSIYMDFGLPFMSSHPLGRPRGWGPARFAEEMYSRYRKQSQVSSFRNLIQSVGHVGAIWDDHDFAWNSACGVPRTETRGKNVVPHDKKLISRSLHMQFRAWLRTRPLPEEYPERPSMEQLLAGPDQGIQESFDVGSVRFLMLDGRYYREEQNVPQRDPLGPFLDEFADETEDVPLTGLLGSSQRAWLSSRITEWPGIHIICSGQALSGKKSDDWEHYSDLEWLAKQRFRKTVFLSGDIHDIKMKRHEELGGLWEFTASGAARPKFGGASGNFGIIEVSADDLEAALYDEDGLDRKRRISFQ